LAKFLNIEKSVTLIHDDALNMLAYDLPKVDLVLTSPPYYNLEIYSHETTQSITNHSTYSSWSQHFYRPLIHLCLQHLTENGVSCWNVGKMGSDDMWADLEKYHTELGYNKCQEFGIVSSKRQAINKTGSEKSQDTTAVYKA
jgi:DNA modification methylase